MERLGRTGHATTGATLDASRPPRTVVFGLQFPQSRTLLLNAWRQPRAGAIKAKWRTSRAEICASDASRSKSMELTDVKKSSMSNQQVPQRNSL